MKRRYLTRRERAEMAERQGGLCFTWGCTGKPDIAEHSVPVALGNDAKPDCLLCKDCARAKTYGRPGRVGGDIRDIAHTNRIAEKRTQHDKRLARGPLIKSARKLVSRGFDKLLRKRMDGTVERRR